MQYACVTLTHTQCPHCTRTLYNRQTACKRYRPEQRNCLFCRCCSTFGDLSNVVAHISHNFLFIPLISHHFLCIPLEFYGATAHIDLQLNLESTVYTLGRGILCSSDVLCRCVSKNRRQEVISLVRPSFSRGSTYCLAYSVVWGV